MARHEREARSNDPKPSPDPAAECDAAFFPRQGDAADPPAIACQHPLPEFPSELCGRRAPSPPPRPQSLPAPANELPPPPSAADRARRAQPQERYTFDESMPQPVHPACANHAAHALSESRSLPVTYFRAVPKARFHGENPSRHPESMTGGWLERLLAVCLSVMHDGMQACLHAC